MINIFGYQDYRSYLKDFYNEKKSEIKGYSYKQFSLDAGLKSSHYLYLVITGKRDVTMKNVFQFLKALKLNKEQAEYFENLVKIEKALNFEDRMKYFEALYQSNKKKNVWVLKNEQYRVLFKWYYLAVRELVLFKNFKEDPTWIAQVFNNQITQEEASEALQTLKDLKLLVYQDSKLVQADQNTETTTDIASTVIQNYHKIMIMKALEALRDQDVKERNIVSLTVAISDEKIQAVKDMINRYKKEINDFLIEDKNPNKVYQLNMQFFNLG